VSAEEGLEELKAALRTLPADLAAEAGPIVTGAAEAAQSDASAAYPAGGLRDGLALVTEDGGRFGAAVTVKNRAPHAWLFEYGTATRHTSLGWNRGAMPPGKVFVPAMERARRAMYDRLRELLRAAGLTVTG
jgi:hypothetical protein